MGTLGLSGVNDHDFITQLLFNKGAIKPICQPYLALLSGTQLKNVTLYL